MKIIDKCAWIHIHDKRLLCVRSRGRELFYTPGGKREEGETEHEALIREVREELSVDLLPASIRPFGVFQAQADGKGPDTQVRLTCFTAAFAGTLRPEAEIEELAWLGIGDLERCSAALVLVMEDARARGLV